MKRPLKNLISTMHAPFAACGTPGKRLAVCALALLPLALAMPIVASAAQASAVAPPKAGPLVERVRAATARYRDITVALSENPPFVPATPCVSGPSEGAMGVHLVRMDRVGDGILKAEEPEALIYEPLPDGSLRLVGVEFIALADTVPGGPSLEGHLLNYVGAPNRYGLPAFYEMHVWAWQENPKGSFADWNTNVSCNAQPLAVDQS